MANYPKELLDLVQEYLTDGVITAKERQVLINKAMTLGVDPNEFDLYIDAQEQKLQNVAAEAAKQQKGRLCPFCQASLPMFADKCPECGGNITPEASKEVEELINTLEQALVDFKGVAEKKKAGFSLSNPQQGMQQLQDMKNVLSGKGVKTDNTNVDYATKKAEVERYIRKAKMYYNNNKTVNFLVAEVETAIADSEKSVAAAKKKKTIIIASIVGAFILFYVCLFAFVDFRSTAEKEDDFIQEVVELVNSGDLAEADQMLTSHNIPDDFKGHGEEVYPDDIVKKYDAAYLALVNAYLNQDNYNAAEAIAGSYKSKINNIYSWRRSSVYAKLKSYCDKNGIDFSILDSESDSKSSNSYPSSSNSDEWSSYESDDEETDNEESDNEESNNEESDDVYGESMRMAADSYEEAVRMAADSYEEAIESYGW